MIGIKKHIKLSSCSILFREDGIVEVVFKHQLLLEIEDCYQIMDTYKEYLENKKVPILHIIGNYMNVTKESREFGASPEGLKYSSAEAYVFDSLPHRIIGNFYLKFNKPSVPTKFFKTKPEAEVWLKTFLKK